MEKKATTIKIVSTALLIVLLGLAGIFMFKGYREGHFASVESLQAYVETFGAYGPVVLTLIQMLQVILPVLPGFLGSVVGSALFGVAGSFWCNYIGISLGSIIAFLLAKRYGITFVRKMISIEKHQKWVDWVNKKKSYTLILFLVILLPLAPDDFFCYFSGLADMSARKFIWIILVAKPWCILAYAIFFARII